jgi:uncharacterized membrane protein
MITGSRKQGTNCRTGSPNASSRPKARRGPYSSPAAFGILFVIFGVVSQMKEGLRKHLMHAAAVLALIGLVAVGGRLLSRLGDLTASVAVLSQVAMAVICLIFLVLAVRSFIGARRERAEVL